MLSLCDGSIDFYQIIHALPRLLHHVTHSRIMLSKAFSVFDITSMLLNHQKMSFSVWLMRFQENLSKIIESLFTIEFLVGDALQAVFFNIKTYFPENWFFFSFFSFWKLTLVNKNSMHENEKQRKKKRYEFE